MPKYTVFIHCSRIVRLSTARSIRSASSDSRSFADSVRALEAYEGLHCVIAYIDDRPRGGYFFQLFLTRDLSEMITCFGVKLVPEKKDAPSDVEK